MVGWWSKSKNFFRTFLIMFLTRYLSTLVLRSFSTVILPILPSTSSARMRMPGDYRYSYRLATRNDIPSITSVNVMSLPENYSREYYQRHLSSWPKLAVVAENEDEKVIGYALGIVEMAGTPGFRGHIASIAVLSDYRGRGVGKDMMKMLHLQFVNEHKCDSVSLHCRVSNKNAINLYLNLYGYKSVEVMEGYYDDGEDALLMRLDNLREQVLKEI